jgi:hypothetical protein
METIEETCIILNFSDEVKRRQYKAAEERFYHLCDHLFPEEEIIKDPNGAA